MIAEVQIIAGTASKNDLDVHVSLFANGDVAQFLSIATEAAIYTESLSSAFVSALEAYTLN